MKEQERREKKRVKESKTRKITQGNEKKFRKGGTTGRKRDYRNGEDRNTHTHKCKHTQKHT